MNSVPRCRAQECIQDNNDSPDSELRIHMAQIRPDVQMGEDALRVLNDYRKLHARIAGMAAKEDEREGSCNLNIARQANLL